MGSPVAYPVGADENGSPAYDGPIAGERELVKPPPTLASLEEISGPALLAMAIAGTIAVLDGVSDRTVLLIGLLAIPPVVAAISASVPETGIVAAGCLVLAVLSGLWNANLGSSEYTVGVLTVAAGGVAGLWVASLRLDLHREQQAAEVLAEAGMLLNAALDQRECAGHLTQLAVPALGDVAMVDMLAPDGAIVRLAARSRGSEVADLFLELRESHPIRPDGSHPVAEVIRTGKPVALDPLSEEQIGQIAFEDSERRALRENRFKHCLVLPLRGRARVLGALTLWIMRPGNSFDPTARRTADRLAERGALALDNARLHQEQAHIAGVLQHSLLPRRLPEIPGFDVASQFLAAGEAYAVGGDFYDAFRTGSGNWSVVIGDVCGKGPEAAALTSLARYTIRTATTPRAAPSSVLRVLHDSISAERSDLRFCTAALVRLDGPSNGRGGTRMTVALGGHPPPLVLRRDGSVEAIGTPGTLLGAIPEPRVADASAELGPGDAIVLYTDGVLATEDRRGADDPGWLAKELGRWAGAPSARIAEGLARAAIDRQGGAPRDDIAVLVLRRDAS